MFRVILFPFLALLVLLALIPSPAPGCAIAPRLGSSPQSVQVQSEQAVIIYDESTQTEHFIRTASFSGTSADFGFLVPTPSKPEIAEVEEGIYSDFANVTKPRIEIRKVKKSNFSLGCAAEAKNTFSQVAGMATPAMPKSDVQVIEQKRVGNLDYAILQAETPQALRDWLAKNNYEDRPELTEWLKQYTTTKWFISAFKIASDLKGPAITSAGPNEPPKTIALTGTTVRMSFKTDRPYYPYREPSDARMSNPPGGRLLRVFLLASTISMGSIGLNQPKDWPARTVWAGLTPKDSVSSIATKTKLTSSVSSNAAWYLTEFEDHSSPRPGTDEVYFGPAKDQSPIERPPIIHYEYIDTTRQDTLMFLGIVFIGVLALVIGIAMVVRRFNQKT